MDDYDDGSDDYQLLSESNYGMADILLHPREVLIASLGYKGIAIILLK